MRSYAATRRITWSEAWLAGACIFACLAATASPAFAQGAQQGSQPPPSLKQQGSSSPASSGGSNQNQSAPAPSLKSSPQKSSGQGATQGNSSAGTSAQAAPQPSPEETQDYQALQKEVDPDKQIQMVKDFAQKYPASQRLSDAYFVGATAAEQKNDVVNALDFGRKSLKLQSGNLRSLILVAGLLPLPQALPPTATQRQQQLTESENDAARALQLLSSIQPQPSVPATQFNQTKAVIEAQLHSALGMAHLEESTMAVSQPPPPELATLEKQDPNDEDDDVSAALESCRQGERYQKQYRLDDAINAFTQAAQAGQGTDIQAYANTVVQQLNVEKSELASAEQEFKTVVAGPQPAAQDFYRLGEVYTREDKLDEAISAFTQAGQLAPGTMIQKYAAQMIQQLQALKAKNPRPQNSSTAAPASGAAPASASAPASQPAKQ